MKKIAVLLLVLVLISGCGKSKEKMTCSKIETNNGVTEASNINLQFDDSKTTKITITTDYNLGTYKTHIDSFITSLEDETKLYLKENGFKSNVTKVDESNIKTEIEFSVLNASENLKIAYNLDSMMSYDGAKDYYEKLGYQCK